MFRASLYAFGLILPLSHAVMAEQPQLSADQFLQRCQQSSAEAQGFCSGYIAGIADSAGICIPEDINDETLGNLVSSSLAGAGEQPAAQYIQSRLLEVFPCKESKQEKEKQDKGGKSQNWSNKERKPG